MGYLIIDGLGSSRASNPPNATVLGNLYHYLYGWANASRNVVINGYGSALGPGQFINWTPKNVAGFVNAGNVFIDWCEWPMYYQVFSNGSQTPLSGAGFQFFAGYLGYDWLTNENFSAGAIRFNGYPMSHGYQQRGAQNGIFLPVGTGNYVQDFPSGQYADTLNAGGFASMMGLYRPGIGWYFYAAFSPFTPPNRVSHLVYGAFIAACLHHQQGQAISVPGGTMTVQYVSYQAPTVTIAPTTSGPTSPYRVSTSTPPTQSSTSPGATSTSTSTTPGASTPSSTSSGFTLPPWQELAAGAALFGGAAVVVLVVAGARH